MDCAKLDHVTSHMDYVSKDPLSLDMVCREPKLYHLISFASPLPIDIRVKLKHIKIVKIDDFTLISFERELKTGLASLFFESDTDARTFNRDVYIQYRKNFKVII